MPPACLSDAPPGSNAAAAPDEASLRHALFLTNGNAAELRRYAPGLFGEQDAFGISTGYKVAAALRKEADTAAI